jgi:hypothetical protein
LPNTHSNPENKELKTWSAKAKIIKIILGEPPKKVATWKLPQNLCVGSQLGGVLILVGYLTWPNQPVDIRSACIYWPIMVLGIPPHSHSYFPLSRSLILIPLPFSPLTLIPLYYV